MIEALISSKTRIKLILKFFLNANTRSYLRDLETEFGESTNGIRIELNRFEQAGMLTSAMEGRRKMFQANREHPLFSEMHSIVLKYFGFHNIIEQVIQKLGDLDEVYVTGEFAKGRDSDVVDLVFFGDIDQAYLLRLIGKAEPVIKRRIRFLVYPSGGMEASGILKQSPAPLLLWTKNPES